MIYIITSLVISSLALIIAFVTMAIFWVSGKKVMAVFTQMNDNLNLVNANFSGIISQNNADHDQFHKTLKRHAAKLEDHDRRITEIDDTIRPRKVIKTMRKNEPTQ